jgi:hypothetical protein
VASKFEVWRAFVWVVADIAAILGLVGIIFDFEKHILDPCFDIASLVGVADCFRNASTAEADEASVEEEEIDE